MRIWRAKGIFDNSEKECFLAGSCLGERTKFRDRVESRACGYLTKTCAIRALRQGEVERTSRCAGTRRGRRTGYVPKNVCFLWRREKERTRVIFDLQQKPVPTTPSIKRAHCVLVKPSFLLASCFRARLFGGGVLVINPSCLHLLALPPPPPSLGQN